MRIRSHDIRDTFNCIGEKDSESPASNDDDEVILLFSSWPFRDEQLETVYEILHVTRILFYRVSTKVQTRPFLAELTEW